MNRTLSDNTRFRPYKIDKRVKKNAFIHAEEKFNRRILNILKSFIIPEEIYEKIKSTGSQPARLYGLPKVHKSQTNPKYRPILSMPNAYCTNLARWLDNILKTFLPDQFTTKDTFDFVEKLKSLNFQSDKYFTSYDVESLFTQIPVEETIDYICKFIPNSELPITKATLKELLQLACKNILFSFDKKLYEQFDGMCMGSNLGPTMAAFTMHMVETQYKIKPLFYVRYVDDVLAVFNNKTESIKIFDHINNFHKIIRFTQEHEKDGKLTFLDVEIIKQGTEILTKWHLKATNTGTYVPKQSYSPKSHKTAAIKSLIYRAYRICSSEDLFKECYSIIESIFINNGYHYDFIEKIKNKTIKNFHKKQETPRTITNEETSTIKTKYITINYMREHENKLNKVAKLIEDTIGRENIKICTSYRTRKTQSFFSNKDKIPTCVRSNIVYSYTCDQCLGHQYIGQSVRHFYTRKHEHINGSANPTEVTSHIHTVKEENFAIVVHTKYTSIGESLIYHSVPPSKRLNKYHPPYELELFNCDTYEEAVIMNNN